jgi:hypothetical protein
MLRLRDEEIGPPWLKPMLKTHLFKPYSMEIQEKASAICYV